MSVGERAPAIHQDISPASTDAGSAAAICFQSAGQVVTVLGKLDRHFYDNSDLADFTKRAVAEYAAKRETQIVAVVVTKDGASIGEDDATKHLSINGQDYAVTIGDLRDGRTQMDHINRVIERLKYLQAVMVMLSTTDMLGTSQAVGKQMGGLNTKVQQVQKLGVKLEQFAKQVTQAQKDGKPLPAETLKPILAQLNRLSTSANPPEIRKIVQTMLTQVKELRQLPIMREGVVLTQASKTQLHLATKNDAPVKTEARFKVPLKLVASKDMPQQPRISAAASEPVKVTQHFTVLTPARTEQLHTRIVSAANVNQAARVQPIVSLVSNDNRFRVVPQQLAKAIETRQVTAPVAAPVTDRANIAPTATQRFSVVTDAVKQAPVLTTLAQASSVVSAPIAALPQSNAQISNIAVVQPAAHVSQPIAQMVQQASPVQQAVQQPIQQAAPVQVAAVQTATVQPVTVQAPNVVPSNGATVVPTVQTAPITQSATVEQGNSQPVEAKVPAVQPNSNGVNSNPVAEAQPQRTQETPRSTETARVPTHSEPQRNAALADSSIARTEPVQPANKFGGTPNNDNPARDPQLRQALKDAGKPSAGADGRDQPPSNETARVPTVDRNSKPQQPSTQEGDEKKDPKKTPTVAREFGSCGETVCKCPKPGNAPTGTPTTGLSPSKQPVNPNPKNPVRDQFGPACGDICLCAKGQKQNVVSDELPVGEREFGRRTRRATAPQANAA